MPFPGTPIRARHVTLLLLSAALLAPAGCGSARDTGASAAASESAEATRPGPVSVMPVQLDSLGGRPGAKAVRITVRRDTSTFSVGRAVVTLASGDTLVVGDSAYRAWTLGSGSLVAISGLDGAGGYESEGQSLTVIDVATGARRRVLADYFTIVRVELLEAAGQRALLVHMRDGGQGGLHVSVVDPDRGQVFRALHALGRVAGDRILVAGFGDGDVPVDFGDTRTPLRVDTLSLSAVDTLSLLVVPRSPK